MANKQMQKLIEEFHLKEGAAGRGYGVTERGIPYTVFYNSNSIQVIFGAKLNELANKKDISKQFKTTKFVMNAQPTQIVFTAQNLRNLQVRLHDLLDVVSEMKEIEKGETCILCGQGNCDSLAPVAGVYRAVHQKCFKEYILDQTTQLEEKTGNYFTGAIGAFLGALVVTLIGLLIIKFTNTSFGYIFFLSGLAATWGYKKLKGKLDFSAKVIIAVMCAFAFIVYLYALYYVYVFDGLPLSLFFDFFDMITQDIFSFDFLLNCWFEILFFVIGVGLAVCDRGLNQKTLLDDVEADQACLTVLTPKDDRFQVE